MIPIVGNTYTGPLGHAFMVVAIEGGVGEMQWVAIRGAAPGCGTIRFPIGDTGKWLKPLT